MELSTMRVLWVGDAVIASGFAECTHAVCNELAILGHEVAVVGINYHGDPHQYPYPIYPAINMLEGGTDVLGVSRFPKIVCQFRPDVVVLLNDPWNIPYYLAALSCSKFKFPLPAIIAWLAVDSLNQKGKGLNNRLLTRIVTWTRFAQSQLHKGGYRGKSSVIPLGVDLSIFHPRDRVESRKQVCPPGVTDEHFIVGVVGRNQPRKRLDLSIQYFAEWVKNYDVPNAMLYLHVAPTGDMGADLLSLIKYYGLEGAKGRLPRVMLHEPNIGHGIPREWMGALYCAFDVYMTQSQCEGWGLPALEAMASRVPCVLPNFAAFDHKQGWVGDAAELIPIEGILLNPPVTAETYTIGGFPSKEGTIAALHRLYTDQDRWLELSLKGLDLAATLPWSLAAQRMADLIISTGMERRLA